MSIRTFKQLGEGYGPSEVSITAKIDDVVVYSGPIITLNEPLPVIPDPVFDINDTLYSWEADNNFSGQMMLEIEVNGGTLLLTDIWANQRIIGDFDSYGPYYSYIEDGETIFDPFEDEKIDGISQPKNRTLGNLYGQWWWIIHDGSVFTAKINVVPGVPLIQWNNLAAYRINALVQDSGTSYQAIQYVPPFTAITDTEYWKSVGPI